MSKSLFNRFRQAAGTALTIGAVSACANVEPSRVPITAAPDVAPQRPLTSFSAAQSCVDRRMAGLPGRRIVTVGNFVDRTKTASVGGREMIEAAIRNTSRASGFWGVRRYDFIADTVGLQGSPIIPSGLLRPGESPDFLIVGSVTQLDQGIETASNSGSLIFGDSLGIGAQQNEQGGILGIDLQAFRASNGDLVAQSSNTITVLNKQQAANARGRVQTFGITAEVALERQDGVGAAARALIDLGVIELLGELTGVPYWECLSIPSTNPQVAVVVERWWRSLGRERQRKYLESRLINLGYLRAGDGPGAFSSALARYETAVGLTADGRPDAQVYAALLHTKPSDDVASASTGDILPTPPAPQTPDPQEAQRASPGMKTSFAYDPDQGLNIGITVFRRGYVRCYLQLQTGEVVQIYPNPFQPAGFQRVGQFSIPRSTEQFKIKLDDRPEDLLGACVHTGREISQDLPKDMNLQPFTPLPGRNLQSVVQAISATNAGVQIKQFRLPATLRKG